MSKAIKRTLSLLLCAAVLLCAAPLLSANAQESDGRPVSLPQMLRQTESVRLPYPDNRDKAAANRNRAGIADKAADQQPKLANGGYNFYDADSWSSPDGTIVWAAETRTLTLKNAAIHAGTARDDDTFGLRLPPDQTTIVLEGENRIECADSAAGQFCFGIEALDVIIQGAGTLTIEIGKSPVASYGINAYQNLVISEAQVYVTSGEAPFSIGTLSYTGSIDLINGAGLQSNAGTSLKGKSYGVLAEWDVTLQNAALIAVGGTSGETRGIYGDKLYAEDGHIYACGGDVTNACSSENRRISYGIDLDSDCTLTNGSEVVATSGEVTTSGKVLCMGITTSGVLTVDGESKLVAAGRCSSSVGQSGGIHVVELQVKGNAYVQAQAACRQGAIAAGTQDDITVDRGNLLCATEGSESGTALFANDLLKIVNGHVLGYDQSTNTGTGIGATRAEITGGRVIGVTTAKENSCGILTEEALSITGGYVSASGQTSAIMGSEGLNVGSDMLITASLTHIDSGPMSTGKTGNYSICVPSGKSAKTAEVKENLKGSLFRFSLPLSTLHYKGSTQIGVRSVYSDMYLLRYTSSDPQIAVVDSNGIITALGKGTATITVRAYDSENNPIKDSNGKEVSAQFEVTCTLDHGRLHSVTIDDLALHYKSTATLRPVITADPDMTYTVSYASYNSNVAPVNAKGEVSGLKFGSSTITCTVTDQYGKSVTDTCTVTVNYTWWQWIIVIVLFGWLWY